MLALETGRLFGTDVYDQPQAQLLRELGRIERNAAIIGVGATIAGAIAGGFVGRWAGHHKPWAIVGGAASGSLAVGLGGFFVSRRIMASQALSRGSVDIFATPSTVSPLVSTQ